MSALEDKILKICEQMFKVYEAGQLSGVNIQALSSKVNKIPFVEDTSTEEEPLSYKSLYNSKINGNGEIITGNGYEDYQISWFHVEEGRTFFVSGTTSDEVNSKGEYIIPLAVFLNDQNVVVGCECGNVTGGEQYVENVEVVVPVGATTMCINTNTNSDFALVRGYKTKPSVGIEQLSDSVRILLEAKGINTEYIWYANIDAVAKTESPLVKIGGISNYKVRNSMFTVLAASGIVNNLIAMDLTAKTVDAIVSAGNFSKFHNGDLLLYAGGYEGVEAWRWIPQAEAKEDRDGWESAWDKQQVNKVPGIESLLEHMPKEITFHTEAGLLNWISKDGIHYVKAQTGNSANPVTGTTKQSYMVYVGREFNGSDFTGKRFQLAHHLATNRYFYRIGTVASGGSFDGYAWKEIT